MYSSEYGPEDLTHCSKCDAITEMLPENLVQDGDCVDCNATDDYLEDLKDSLRYV